MNYIRNENNDVNGTGTSCEGASSGRCSVGEQRRPGRNQETARMKWTKEMNIVVMECFYSARPFDENGVPKRGYRQRMFRAWKERGVFNTTEQRLCDQARAIRKNGWLTDVELESIKRRVLQHDEVDGIDEREEVLPRLDVEGEINEGYEADVRIEVNEEVEITPEELQIIEEVKELLTQGEDDKYIMFKKVDRKKLRDKTQEVNGAIKHIVTASITHTNNLIKAASCWVAKQLGLRTVKQRKRHIPWWQRRIEGDIKNLRKDVNILEREKRGENGVKGKRIVKNLADKYRINRKGLETVIEELKQRLLAKAAKIKRYNERITQYRQNRMFAVDRKKVLNELNGENRGQNVVPGAEESRKFWSEIWGSRKEHNRQAEWLNELKRQHNNVRMEEVEITTEMVKNQCRKIPNWKTPGRDGVQGYWIKNLTSVHERIAAQLNEIVCGVSRLPEWMTYGRTVLIQKDPTKGGAVDNYRPISCLPLMWKLLTGMIAGEVYKYLEKENILPDEQKGCRKGSRGTKDQLLIDKAVLTDCKRRKTNLSLAWIDYRKAYDLVPHSWISECLEMVGIATNIREFLSDSMQSWKLELTSSGERLGDVHIKRGIFQGDSLSPLLFTICMIPLTLILRKVTACYEWGDKEFKVNHLLFMDDLKLFAKNRNQMDSLVKTVHVFSTDIGMELGLSKCGVLVLKKGKIVKENGISLPNGDLMKEIDEHGYKYLGIVELDKLKEKHMKDKSTSEYKRRFKLVLKSKLNGKNKILAISTWAVPVLRYGEGILKWTATELKSLDRKSRKIMTMYGAFHPKSDTDRLYLTREKGGRGLISCEGCVRSEENNLGWYVKNSEESLIQGVRFSDVIDTNDVRRSDEFKKLQVYQRQQGWNEKVMYGQFIREMPESTDAKETWKWLGSAGLKIQTEALLCAAQEQALRTKYIKHHIDKSIESPLCRLCEERGETVCHIVSECKKLAQKEYKRRHDNVARLIHWHLCKKYNFELTDKWYEHSPKAVMEDNVIKLLWDVNIQCDHVIEARRPDIVIINKLDRTCIIVDIAVPGDSRISHKEKEKVEKYQDLKREIKRIWNLRNVIVVPVIVGALGSITKKLGEWIKKLDISIAIELLQKTTILGTARILRKVLDY